MRQFWAEDGAQMPIGIVSDQDFDKELERCKGDVRVPELVPSIQEEVKRGSLVVDTPHRGRKEGDVNVPESLRKIIGEESVINGRAAAVSLAEELGISPSSVSAYAKGATSTASYNNPSSGLVKHLNKSRARAVKKAGHVLRSALDAISQEKLDHSDAKDLASISKDMSVIIKNLEPQAEPVDRETKTSPQFVIFAPQFREEKTFEVIQINE